MKILYNNMNENRPMCEVKGCDLTSRTNLYGHYFCWDHYTQWIENWRIGAFNAHNPQLELFPDIDRQEYNANGGNTCT